VICPDVEASEGDEIEIAGDSLKNATTGKTYKVLPLPKARQAIVDAGGLIPYTRKLLLERK
jgi:3-isopropylmalate/(R)-2-methylmalate dehydratase small subunit